MKKLLAVLLALVLVGAAAWFVADRVESPEQVAARAEPPRPEPVTAPLVRGFLNAPVSVATTAQHEQERSFVAPAALEGRIVTSRVAAVSDEIRSGSVLLRANGRPVFALDGDFALYRDIEPGDVGDDVRALQASLGAAGYALQEDGTYGPNTQAALVRMYRDAGYEVPRTPLTALPVDDVSDEAAGSSITGTPLDNEDLSVENLQARPAGPRVVMSEIVMIPSLPATVGDIAPVGSVLSIETELIALDGGDILLAATLPSSSVESLAKGAEATFLDDAGEVALAHLSGLRPTEAGDETHVTLSPKGSVAPGGTYVVTIENPAGETGESLLAPISAVVSRGGRSYVYVADENSFSEVEVSVDGAVGGIAAVSSADPSNKLNEGTVVRIG